MTDYTDPYADLVIPDPVDEPGTALARQAAIRPLRRIKALPMSHFVAQAMAEVEARHEHGFVGFRTSLKTLNPYVPEMFGPGKVVVLAGGSGVAKTTLVSQLVIESAEAGLPTYLASMEDNGPDNVKRMLANTSNGNVGQIRAGFRDIDGNRQPIPTELDQAAARLEELSDAGLLRMLTPQVTVTELAWSVSDWRKEHADEPFGMVFVDQLGHLLPEAAELWRTHFPYAPQPPRNGARDDKVWEWQVSALKAIAETYSVCVVVAHQLNEVRDDSGKPTLGSIRDSKGIVHKANTVLAAWRPTRLPNPNAGPGEPKTVENTEGRMWLLCLKYREGATFELEVEWQGAHQRIADLGTGYAAPRNAAPQFTDGQKQALRATADLSRRWDRYLDAAAEASETGQPMPAPPVQRKALGQLGAKWALPAAPARDAEPVRKLTHVDMF